MMATLRCSRQRAGDTGGTGRLVGAGRAHASRACLKEAPSCIPRSIAYKQIVTCYLKITIAVSPDPKSSRARSLATYLGVPGTTIAAVLLRQTQVEESPQPCVGVLGLPSIVHDAMAAVYDKETRADTIHPQNIRCSMMGGSKEPAEDMQHAAPARDVFAPCIWGAHGKPPHYLCSTSAGDQGMH